MYAFTQYEFTDGEWTDHKSEWELKLEGLGYTILGIDGGECYCCRDGQIYKFPCWAWAYITLKDKKD